MTKYNKKICFDVTISTDGIYCSQDIYNGCDHYDGYRCDIWNDRIECDDKKPLRCDNCIEETKT